jgi:hypothetical protein
MILDYELQGAQTNLRAITTAIPLFMCWMTWVTAFTREALVIAFMRALYHL